MHISNTKAMDIKLVRDRLIYLKVKAENKSKVRELKEKKPSQKRDALIWMLEGRPFSVGVAQRELGINSNRDVIYSLKKMGYDIKCFWRKEKLSGGRVSRFRVFYLSCYPESVILYKSQF